jgi:hypothetical protein
VTPDDVDPLLLEVVTEHAPLPTPHGPVCAAGDWRWDDDPGWQTHAQHLTRVLTERLRTMPLPNLDRLVGGRVTRPPRYTAGPNGERL